ncbi:hypothetical protein FOA52_004215 [Chlamydomonas sp. UWO 241]|nr:hypothetical protein FOA52_004215 [Chlamydomonas sp. UWO 241]
MAAASCVPYRLSSVVPPPSSSLLSLSLSLSSLLLLLSLSPVAATATRSRLNPKPVAGEWNSTGWDSPARCDWKGVIARTAASCAHAHARGQLRGKRV